MDSQPPKPRLQEQFHALMRAHHYSIRTEKSYWYWIRFYLRFHQMCGFHADSDTHSTHIRTVIPR